MEWYRSDNGVVSGKIAGKKHIEDRRKIGYSQVNNPIILRVSYVYVTYILRMWYVIDSGKIRKDWVKIVHIELRILNFEGKSCVYLKKIVPL